jgi:uncharacterized BrkB/YihY/UPF0761 family membrane protein
MMSRTPRFEIFDKAIKRHLVAVGIAQIVLNALWICGETISFFILRARNLAADSAYIPQIPTYISVFTSIVLMVNIIGIAGGYGVLKRERWAWRVVFVVSVIEIIGFLIGALVGIYSLWVLLKEEVKELYGVSTRIPFLKRSIERKKGV